MTTAATVQYAGAKYFLPSNSRGRYSPSPMIWHEGALVPRQSETRVLMIVLGLLRPTFSRPLPEISLIASGEVKAK